MKLNSQIFVLMVVEAKVRYYRLYSHGGFNLANIVYFSSERVCGYLKPLFRVYNLKNCKMVDEYEEMDYVSDISGSTLLDIGKEIILNSLPIR